MKNSGNYHCVGKFVIAPRGSNFDTDEIRKLSGADDVELMLVPDEDDYETSIELYDFHQSMNIGYEFLNKGCSHEIDIYKLNGTPNSEKLLAQDNSILCIEFNEVSSRNFHHNAYRAFFAQHVKDCLEFCYPKDISLSGVVQMAELTDSVSSAYVEAVKKFDKASSDLIEECVANMKTALSPAW